MCCTSGGRFHQRLLVYWAAALPTVHLNSSALLLQTVEVWFRQCINICFELKWLRAGELSSPWSSMHSLLGIKKRDRVLELVDLAAMSNSMGPTDLYVDISQNPKRHPWWRGHHLRTLTTVSQIYMFQHDRLLLPIEKFFFLGWERDSFNADSLSNAQINELTGNAFTLPQIAVLLTGIMAGGMACPGARS